MLLQKTIPLAFLLMLLAGCATPVEQIPVATGVEIPPVPADIQNCRNNPVSVPDRSLTVEEIERLWKTDRARLARLNSCFERILCQYAEVRREIAKIDDRLCAPKSNGKGWGLVHGKGR